MNRREFLQGAATAAAVAAVPVAAVPKSGLPVGDVVVFDRELSEPEVRRVSQIVLHQTAGGWQGKRPKHDALYHYAVSYSGRLERLA